MENNIEEDLEENIGKLVDEKLEGLSAVKGISIATNLATDIYTKMKDELDGVSSQNLVASATSFQYIAKSLYEYCLSEEIQSTYVTVEKYILLLVIIKKIAATVVLDRQLAELEGMASYKKSIKELVLQINAVIETTDYVGEDPFVSIKRAIPTATLVAIISKEGMPIRVEGDNIQLHEAMIGSQIAALSNSTQVIMNDSMDFSVIEGNAGHIIVVQLDEERILAVSIPEMDQSKIGTYIAKIKAIVKKQKK